MGQGIHHTNAMIIDLTAGRACAIGTDTPLEFSSFGRAALSSAFKVICLPNFSVVPELLLCRHDHARRHRAAHMEAKLGTAFCYQLEP